MTPPDENHNEQLKKSTEFQSFELLIIFYHCLPYIHTIFPLFIPIPLPTPLEYPQLVTSTILKQAQLTGFKKVDWFTNSQKARFNMFCKCFLSSSTEGSLRFLKLWSCIFQHSSVAAKALYSQTHQLSKFLIDIFSLQKRENYTQQLIKKPIPYIAILLRSSQCRTPLKCVSVEILFCCIFSTGMCTNVNIIIIL